MDPSAPHTILKGVTITSSFCGLAAGLYGGLKHGAPGKYLVYTAVNSGIVAATFFSIREYLVSPILVLTHPARQYRLRKQILFPCVGNPAGESVSLSWADVRTNHLLDSGISGGLAGSILNAWKRGRRGLTPGLATGALTCTLLQWCFNEFDILRIHYASANAAPPSQCTTHGSIGAEHIPSTGPSASAVTQPTSTELPFPFNSPIDRILSMFGRRVSDEMYLERLKMKRDSHLRRIAELEERKNQ